MNRSINRRISIWRVAGYAIVTAMCMIAMIAASSHESETLAQRRARVASLSAEEKRELLERKARFDKLSPAEQSRLRELYRAIQEHPHRDRLRTVMENYYRWLAMRSPTERAELLSLNREERIKVIEERVREEERQRFLELSDRQLTPADHGAIHKWLQGVMERREAKMLEAIPQLRNLDPPRRHRFMMFGVIGGIRNPAGQQNLMRPTDEELEELAKTLCPRAQEFLNKLDSAETRREVLTKWIRTAVQTRLFPPVDPAKLIEFMKELPPDERGRLEALPRQEMLDDLRRMYMRRVWSRGRPGGSPGGGRRGRSRPRDPSGPEHRR